MALPSAREPTVNDRQHATPVVETPIQRSFRGVLRDHFEEAGDALTDALCADLDSTHLPDDEIAERSDVDKAQLSRIRHHQAHPPGKLITWAIENSRLRPPAYIAAVCAAGEGEFKPKPPPSVEARHEATLSVLHDMGIAEVVIEKAARRLGVAK